MMTEHKTVSIADQIFEQLERDILAGEYERGEILTEAKLSEKLGVSRTPIREALRRLAQEHIIIETTRGASVVGINKDDMRDTTFVCGLKALRHIRRRRTERKKTLRNFVKFLNFRSFIRKSTTRTILKTSIRIFMPKCIFVPKVRICITRLNLFIKKA